MRLTIYVPALLTTSFAAGWVNRLSYIGQQLSCLLPQSLLNGDAPVNGAGGGGAGGDDNEGDGDERASGNQYQMFAPRNRGSAGRGSLQSSSVPSSSTGRTLAGSSSTPSDSAPAGSAGGGYTLAVRGSGSPVSNAATRPTRDALVAAAMRRLQQQASGGAPAPPSNSGSQT